MGNMKRIGNVWMPAGEVHMIPFLTDEKTTVDGYGTYQLRKINRVLDEARRLSRHRCAIDVGAHVGTWTRFLAKNYATVESFEPHPVLCECFKKNMEQWHATNVRLHEFALGEREGTRMLLSNPKSSGDTWLDDGEKHLGYAHVSEVKIGTIDSFEWNEVDLIKVDCEGGELAVLRGAEWTLKSCRPVVCVEQKPGRAEKYGLPRTGACTYLESLGAKLRAELSGDFIYTWD